METASLELCKTLWELSGWAGTERYFQEGGTVWHNLEDDVSVENSKFVCFAYDLGFLLRKLPAMEGPNSDDIGRLTVFNSKEVTNGKRAWSAGYDNMDCYFYIQEADTPEDALCKLAIELFKQGVLKK